MKYTFIVCLLSLVTSLLFWTPLYGQCTGDVDYWTESWESCQLSQNPNSLRGNTHWIMFEFDEPIEIIGTHIWNANITGKSGSGAREIIFDVSADGVSWQQISSSSFLWDRAPETNNYAGFAGPALREHGLVSHVLVTVVSTFDNGNCASIAELKFNVNANACSGSIDECGVCDGLGIATYYFDADGDGLGNKSISSQSCSSLIDGYVTNNDDDCDTGGWAQVGPLFQDNGCTGCHGVNGSSGLDLTSYAGFLEGGNKCGMDIMTGNTIAQIINIEGYAGCGSPINGLSMNDRVGGQIDANELNLIQAWINAGAPETDACCPLFGQICDDADPCTDISVYDFNCNCSAKSNLALAGTPSMNSVYNQNVNENYLNDGIFVSNLSSTAGQSTHDWVQIDLGSIQDIDEVVIWNRINCCQNRLNNVYVLISNSPFASNTDITEALANADFSYQLGNVSNDARVVVPIGQMGRYVRLQKSGNNDGSDIMNIVELEVLGDFISSDSDNDGICDNLDICSGGDDAVDTDGDGVPDHCDVNNCDDYVIQLQNDALNSSKAANIGIETNGIVNAGKNLYYNAADYILLKEGFEVKLQASFHAFIQACQPGNSN